MAPFLQFLPTTDRDLRSPTGPWCSPVLGVYGHVGALGHHCWGDDGARKVLGWSNQSGREEPTEYAGHGESSQDHAQDDQQTRVKEEHRDEATWGDLVDLTGHIARGEAGHRGFEVGALVEESGGVLAIFGCFTSEDGADGGVDYVPLYRSRMGKEVGSEVEDCAVDDHVRGEVRDVIPIVTSELLRLCEFKLVECGECGGGELTKSRIRAWVVGGGGELEPFAFGEVGEGSVEEVRDVLSWSVAGEGVEVDERRVRLRGVDDDAVDGESARLRANPGVHVQSILSIWWTEYPVESYGGETDYATDYERDEAQCDFFPPSLP